MTPEWRVEETPEGRFLVKGKERYPLVEMGEAPEPPAEPCYGCKGTTWWQRDPYRWLCANCHPEPRPL